MFGFLTRLFGPKIDWDNVTVEQMAELKASGCRIHSMDSVAGGWPGNSIKFRNMPDNLVSGMILSVVGWKPNRPRKGELLRMKTASGKIALAKFISVELCHDPHDMFFGEAQLWGYELGT